VETSLDRASEPPNRRYQSEGHRSASTQIADDPAESGSQHRSPHPAQGHLVQNGSGLYDSQFPSTQSSVAPHARPHSPQCRLLVRVFTHPPAQRRVPLGHIDDVGWQLPPAHAWPDAHGLPHPPQFAGSLEVSTHVAPHADRPGLQPQLPAAHTCALLHVFPQSPQLTGSVVTSVQRMPQVLAVLGQVQVPPTQASVPQSVPHAPQFRGSLVVSTHRPPQVAPLHAHLPEMQALAAPQPSPHAPQLFGSFERSLQPPLQLTRPAGQVAPHIPAPHTCPAAQRVPQEPQLFGSDAVSVHRPPHVAGQAPPSPVVDVSIEASPDSSSAERSPEPQEAASSPESRSVQARRTFISRSYPETPRSRLPDSWCRAALTRCASPISKRADCFASMRAVPSRACASVSPPSFR
jgi:hypothetical protein